MANRDESSPLLATQNEAVDEKKSTKLNPPTDSPPTTVVDGAAYGWTADGLPAFNQGNVVGEPMGRTHWDSSLFACLGRNDDFCSSDCEVCILGSVAPCVLYGTNAERLGYESGTFTNHCLPYSLLYVLGQTLFGANWVAPWFSYTTRSAIRRKFNLEGSFEAFNRSCGCCGSVVEDELQREQCESGCDFATHLLCHPCALCQEGRELRRRLPHPGFNAQPVLVMIPPGEQSMGRP